ncbi:MAG: septum formation initiator family protein [Deltaproteobacteria bacterium]|nr:septum formation initiator family protein [Deltaproteobacteria bacterium]
MIKQLSNNPPFQKFTILSVFLFLVATLFGHQGLIDLYRMNKLENKLHREITDLGQQSKKTALLIQSLRDPNRLERTIREELGMVHPDEIAFVVSP